VGGADFICAGLVAAALLGLIVILLLFLLAATELDAMIRQNIPTVAAVRLENSGELIAMVFSD
jgi:hypothetical protein